MGRKTGPLWTGVSGGMGGVISGSRNWGSMVVRWGAFVGMTRMWPSLAPKMGTENGSRFRTRKRSQRQGFCGFHGCGFSGPKRVSKCIIAVRRDERSLAPYLSLQAKSSWDWCSSYSTPAAAALGRVHQNACLLQPALPDEAGGPSCGHHLATQDPKSSFFK